IMLFLQGGPSQLETYDMKPNAPDTIRGPFRPIKTNVSGIEVCEHLPMHARIAHRFSLIRSCSHSDGGHGEGTTRMMSGHSPRKKGEFETGEAPEIGAMVNRVFRDRWNGLPPAVVIGANATATYVPSNDPSYLGAAYRPPRVDRGIPSSNLRTPRSRLDERLGLRGTFDGLPRETDTRTIDSMDHFGPLPVTLYLHNTAHNTS